MSEERLIVALEARIKDFEKKFDRAEKKATGNYSKMRRSSKTATAQMERDMIRSTGRMNRALASTSNQIGVFSKSMKGGIVGALTVGGVTAAVKGFGDVARSMADISREAKRAGVDVKSFQELKFVSEQNRIDVDQMVDGLKELNIRADEFVVTGKGGGADAFKRLGYSATELATKLEKPSDLLVEIIERTGKLEKAAQIRIFDEIFGGSAGERYVELIDQGAEGIRDTIQEANRLGVVFDEDVLKKADEVDRKFHALSTTVSTGLKRAIVEAATELENFIDRFNQVEQRQNQTIKADIGSIRGDRADVDKKIAELVKQKSELDPALRATPKFGRGIVGDIDDKINQLKVQKEDLMQQALKLQDVLDRRNGLGNEPDLSPQQPFVPPVHKPYTGSGVKSRKRKASGSGGRTSRSSAISQIERERNAVKELIAELEHEFSMIGKTDQIRARSEALREAGSAATEEQRNKIILLTDAIHAETEADKLRQEQAEESQRQVENDIQERRDLYAGISGDMRSALSDGKITWNEMANVATNALDRIIDKYEGEFLDVISGLTGGGGGGGGFIGSILGAFGIGGGLSTTTAATSFLKAGGVGLFNDGGFTGSKGGIVHANEFVNNAASTAKYRPHLEAMNRGDWTPPVMAQPVPVAMNNNQKPAPQIIDIHVTGRLVDEGGQVAGLIDEKVQAGEQRSVETSVKHMKGQAGTMQTQAQKFGRAF